MENILDWSSFNEGYNKPRAGGKRRWSVKYKRKINCSNPKGFSQKQYCKRKRRGGHYKTESAQNYKIFESNDGEIKSYLSQIFLELEDEGYDVDIEVAHEYFHLWRWLRTETTEKLTGFKVNISGKDIGEDILPSIETSISYMSSQDFGRYWIKLSNFGVLNIGELKSYLNLKKSLVNPPKTTIELNFQKN